MLITYAKLEFTFGKKVLFIVNYYIKKSKMSKKVKSLFRVLLQITGKYEYKKQTLYYIFLPNILQTKLT